MKGRLEIGRRLLKLLGSEPGFLRIGETAAVLKGEGTEPVVREEWMMAAIRGSSEGRQDMTRAVGRGSNWHVDGFDLQMRSEIAEGSGRWKEVNGRL